MHYSITGSSRIAIRNMVHSAMDRVGHGVFRGKRNNETEKTIKIQ